MTKGRIQSVFYASDGVEIPMKAIIRRGTEISGLPLSCTISMASYVTFPPVIDSMKKNYWKRKIYSPNIVRYLFFFPGFKDNCEVWNLFDVPNHTFPLATFNTYIKEKDYNQVISFTGKKPYNYLESLIGLLLVEFGFAQNEYLLDIDNIPIDKIMDYEDLHSIGSCENYFIAPEWGLYAWDDEGIPKEARLIPMDKMPTYRTYFPFGGKG